MKISVNERKINVCCIYKTLALDVTSQLLNMNISYFNSEVNESNSTEIMK